MVEPSRNKHWSWGLGLWTVRLHGLQPLLQLLPLQQQNEHIDLHMGTQAEVTEKLFRMPLCSEINNVYFHQDKTLKKDTCHQEKVFSL